VLSLHVAGSQVLMHLDTLPGHAASGAPLEELLGAAAGAEGAPAGNDGADVSIGEAPDGVEPTLSRGEEPAGGAEGVPVSAGDEGIEAETTGVPVAVTGQMVVEMAMVFVMTVTELAGQLVTVGAQLVMVISVVVKTVDVVS
jgi:hypothetical protein